MKQMQDLQDQAQKNFELASHSKKKGDSGKINAEKYAAIGATNLSSYQRLLPTEAKMKKNLELLAKVEENWGNSIEKLAAECSVRRSEYLAMKSAAETMDQISEFLNGESEESKVFFESLGQLDQQLALSVSKIEAFEKRSKNMMTTADLEKEIMSEQGMSMLDEYEALGQDIFLPEDFSKEAIAVQATVIESKPLTSTYGNLLSRK
jgi:hypothetical protein